MADGAAIILDNSGDDIEAAYIGGSGKHSGFAIRCVR